MARVRRGAKIDELEARLQVTFSDREWAELALTHASRSRGNGADKSYERLEFLGDRVLGLVIAEKLFELFPKANEGELSLRLNSLVSAESCAEIADEMGLGPFILHGGDLKKLGGVQSKNVRADVVEALIAALYLGDGMEAARAFVLRFWGDRLTAKASARRDPKTALQEWAHARSVETPRYETIDRTGPDHDPVFTVRVTIEGVEPAEGEGRSKRLAEQEAASAVLHREGVWKDRS